MSYDLSIAVKIEGLDRYIDIAYPEYAHPTYNLGTMFRKCMDWDYSQSKKDEKGNYHTVRYKCEDVLEYVSKGIQELTANRKEYEQYNPENGWGNIDGALKTLRSIRDCINETVEERMIPIEFLYFSW